MTEELEKEVQGLRNLLDKTREKVAELEEERDSLKEELEQYEEGIYIETDTLVDEMKYEYFAANQDKITLADLEAIVKAKEDIG